MAGARVRWLCRRGEGYGHQQRRPRSGQATGPWEKRQI